MTQAYRGPKAEYWLSWWETAKNDPDYKLGETDEEAKKAAEDKKKQEAAARHTGYGEINAGAGFRAAAPAAAGGVVAVAAMAASATAARAPRTALVMRFATASVPLLLVEHRPPVSGFEAAR